MLGYPIIFVVLVSWSSSVFGNDEQTSQWLEQHKNGTKRSRLNLDPVTSTNKPGKLQDSVDWVANILQENLNSTTNKGGSSDLNLDRAVDDQKKNQNGEVTCVTDKEEPGLCVPYYLCDQVSRKIIGDGIGLIDVRGRSECGSYLDICCSDTGRVDLKETSLSPAASPTVEKKIDVIKIETTYSQQCGWNNPSISIFQPGSQDVADAGYYANYGDFPWMVAIMKNSEATVWVPDDYMGGGALIHPAVVISVAHKFQNVAASQIKCRAGEWDTQTNKEQYPIQEREVRKLVLHENFFRPSIYNDIAILFLQRPFQMAEAPHVGTACVARILPPPDTQCFSMGWGRNVKTNTYVNVLKKIKVPLVGRDRCQELLRKTRLGNRFELHESLICAGGEENVDTCTGDGGSSLVCAIGGVKGRTQYAVFGLVAYGISCGKKDVPGVYVNIPHLKQWVDQQMVAEGYGNSTYVY